MNKKLKNVAIDAALKSGIFIKKSVGKIGSISYKGVGNIVTDIDKGAEKRILNKILSEFPDHSILTEESSPKIGASPYKWIIDPLDGTTNFAHAFPFFAVSIALEYDGAVILGVVYDPMRDELFYAERGRGAYLNGKPIHVSKIKLLKDSFLATGFSYGAKGGDKNVVNFKNFLGSSLAIRRAGAAALDLSYVACGRFDGYWEIGIQSWDNAAGALLVKEAGGRVSNIDGSAYSQYNRDILATNGSIHTSMISILKVNL